VIYKRIGLWLGVLAAVVVSQSAGAQPIATASVGGTVFTRPVFVTAPAGDLARVFVIEQRLGGSTTVPWVGRLRIVNLSNNTTNVTPYLSITGVAQLSATINISEQGLLGMAFHPQFMTNGNGYFWVNYTRESDGATVIARYRATGGVPTSTTADPASAATMLVIAQPQSNHNGGWMAFGPDGYLYIAMGDGGNGNDTGTGHSTGGNAQDLTSNLLGKMLRLDVDGPDNIPGNADDADPGNGAPYRIPAGNPFNGTNGDREIWAYGLRNPWRPSFDRLTGELWIADVGQDNREEVNVQPGTLAGLNYGWRCMEGFRCTGLSGCVCNAASLVLPILDYDHNTLIPPVNNTGCSITGGYVYRGCAMPLLRGTYFFADYCRGRVWSFRHCSGSIVGFSEKALAGVENITSFGEDARGELYICDQTGGQVFRIVPSPATPNCTVATCGSADFNNDGDVGTDLDIEAFFLCLGGDCCASGGSADFDGDGDTGTDLDIEAFFRVLGGGAC